MKNKRLEEIFTKDKFSNLLYNEEMKNHTTFKIGGPVDVMAIPSDEDELIDLVKLARLEEVPFMIMGNGSNMLVRDGGIEGLVIKLNDNFSHMKVEGSIIEVGSGCLMPKVSSFALANELKGFEFASGIPGTIGGAMTMNAGAYDGEMKNIVHSVRVLNEENEILEYTREEMNFRYRGSRVGDENLIVLSVKFKLEPGDSSEIEAKIKDFTHRRTTKQPLEYPSGGSTFKRPVGYFAGKLIDDAGLRGLKYKGAQVSEKHCGFVINVDKANCKEVLTLIEIVKKSVKDKFGVDLEREIKLIGRE